MKLSSRSNEDPDLNITPLIDVVFLLLIFFMVTTTFERAAQLELKLPEASEQPTQQQPERLEIVVNAEGRYFVGGSEVVNRRLDTLKEAITRAANDNAEQPITIRADARAPHQAVVNAMDAISQLGFVNLSIATIPRDDTGTGE